MGEGVETMVLEAWPPVLVVVVTGGIAWSQTRGRNPPRKEKLEERDRATSRERVLREKLERPLQQRNE